MGNFGNISKFLETIRNEHQIDDNTVNKPLSIFTHGEFISYGYDAGLITEITFKFNDIYYTFRVCGQSIHEDPKIQMQLSNLEKPELYSESWSR